MKRVVLLSLLMLPSCVTLGKYRADLKLQKAQDDVNFLGLQTKANQIIGILRERLVRLSQLDDKGNLVPAAWSHAHAGRAPR
jgi:hypothetical protein